MSGERTCGACVHFIEGPRDFGACCLEVGRHFRGPVDACDAVEWALLNARCGEMGGCGDWEER